MQALAPNQKIGEITSPMEAEAKATEVIRKKHFRVRQIFFKSVKREGNVWFLEGKVSFGFIFTAARNFKLT